VIDGTSNTASSARKRKLTRGTRDGILKVNLKESVALSNKPLQRTAPLPPARRLAVPRRRGLTPAAPRGHGTLGRPFGAAAERQNVRQTKELSWKDSHERGTRAF